MKFSRPFVLLTLLALCGLASLSLQLRSQTESVSTQVPSPVGTTTRPEFEIASVKINSGGGANETIHIGPGRFVAEDLTLRRLIMVAYKVRDFQISGGPGWMNSSRYDIDGRTNEPSGADPMFLMLQKLLEDRFALRFHYDTKEGPVYFLTIAKDGIKMRKATCVLFDPDHLQPHAKATDPPPANQCNGITSRSTGLDRLLDARGLSMADSIGPANQSLAGQLSLSLGRPVIDKTGLTELFDVHLQWTEPAAAGLQGVPLSIPMLHNPPLTGLGLPSLRRCRNNSD